MKFYGISDRYIFYVEQVTSLPDWDSSCTARLIQVNTSNTSSLYFGGLDKWVLIKIALTVRGIFGGGYSDTNVIDYVTISTPSNATNFGDLTVARDSLAATSNGTSDRGIFGGGYSGGGVNTIDYVTISSRSDATDFGDLTVSRYTLAANSNS